MELLTFTRCTGPCASGVPGEGRIADVGGTEAPDPGCLESGFFDGAVGREALRGGQLAPGFGHHFALPLFLAFTRVHAHG